MKKKVVVLCPCCVEAIRSHGEKVRVSELEYTSEEDAKICEWCEELTEEYYNATF